MKKGFFTVLLLVSFIAEAVLCIVLYNKLEDVKQDVVSVNACLKQVENNYGDEDSYLTDLDYTLIDNEGNVTFKTADGLSETVAEAVSNSDPIVDIEVDVSFIYTKLSRSPSVSLTTSPLGWQVVTSIYLLPWTRHTSSEALRRLST